MDRPFRSLYVRPDLAGTSWRDFYARPVVLDATRMPNLQHQRNGLRGVGDDAGVSPLMVGALLLAAYIYWRK